MQIAAVTSATGVVAKTKGALLAPIYNYKQFSMPSIIPVDEQNFDLAIELLANSSLPTKDLTKDSKLFSMQEADKVVGTIGIEVYENMGLLRSLAVVEEKRSAGLGKDLVEFLEDFANREGLKQLFLLTTTADKYFAKKGYQQINRNDVPEPIKKSSEFSSICPSSAIVMKKDFA